MHFEYQDGADQILRDTLGGDIKEFEIRVERASGNDADQASVYPLTGGLSGAATFLVRRVGKRGRLNSWAVKVCNKYELIEAERKNYLEFVRDRLSFVPRLIDEYSLKLLIFEFGGPLGENTQTLRSGYAHATLGALKALMQRLVEGLHPLHKFSADTVECIRRMTLSPPLDKRLRELKPRLPDKVEAELCEIWSRECSTRNKYPCVSSTAHGDLNAGNILFEPGSDASYPVLIDFASMRKQDGSSRYPPFWDYSKIERDIKTRLFLMEVESSLSVDTILEVVEALDRGAAKPPISGPAIDKLWTTVHELRKNVQQKHSPDDFNKCYRLTTAYATLQVFYRQQPDRDQKLDVQYLVAARSVIALLSGLGHTPASGVHPDQLEVGRKGDNTASGGAVSFDFQHQPRPGPASARAERLRKSPLVFLLNDSVDLPRQRVLHGRESALSHLHQAWDSGKPGARDGRKTNLLIISGAPGEGKTALVRQWRNVLLARADDSDLPDLIFEHSFSGQGASSAREVSSFWFLRRACESLGVDVPSIPPEGVRVEQYMREQLARRMKEQRAVLFLDGVEPLQSMPPDAMLHDAELRHLLNDLAAANPGLVVVTTRHPFYNLDTATPGGPCDHYRLPTLDHRAAMDILDEYNVQGTEAEKREIVELFRLNALSLHLLGNFLRDSPVRRWWEISRQLEDATAFQDHTNILRAFDDRFGPHSQEVSLLRMLGLFDRAVSLQLLDELCKSPIDHLNEPLLRADTSGRKRAREVLVSHRLIDWRGESAELDCHPLVRQYYSEQLRALDGGSAWRSAHGRLYEHFLGYAQGQDGVAKDEWTRELLFQAIYHGCRAGREREAFDLYLNRIEGGEDRLHATEGLGLTAMTLEAISNFFDKLWREPKPSFKDSPAHGWLLSQAGYRLQYLGRLDEAREPKQAALCVFEDEKRWDKAATEAGRLCELHVYAGQPDEALKQAQKALEYAGRVPHSPDQWYQRAKLAWVYHYLGDRDKAAREFKAAEETFLSMNSDARFMCHSAGFLYCDFLLDEPKHAEDVIQRAEWMLEMSARQEGRTFRRRQVDEGQAKIALGHALLHRAQEKDLAKGAGSHPEQPQVSQQVTSTTGGSPASQAREISNEPLEWDFFLAYASADRSWAEGLYAALSTNHRVFLDVHAVRPGDDWPRTISRALAATRLTIILISANSEEAHYLHDEISTAIQLARKDAKRRRVIPVFLDGFPSNVTAVPYGLGSIQGLDARKLGMEGIAVELRKAAARQGVVSQAHETSRPAQAENHTLAKALELAEDAARILREAYIIDELPRALLLRARVCMQLGRFPDAERDLNEVENIARRGGFVFYQVDVHLLRALLLERWRAEISRVKKELAEAARMADKQRYRRRVRLIEDARARLARHPRPLTVSEEGDASS